MKTKNVRLRLGGAARTLERAKEARDQTIREASLSGITYREIAELTGLSHQRVHQIVKATPRQEVVA